MSLTRLDESKIALKCALFILGIIAILMIDLYYTQYLSEFFILLSSLFLGLIVMLMALIDITNIIFGIIEQQGEN